MDYNHEKVEKKWRKKWEKKKLYSAEDFSAKPKFYGLIEFPYPSGEGLHVGHVRSNTAMDIICRKRRMAGYNVLYPIGWDAFGLPTENYAIKTGIHPKIVTKKNTGIFRRQLKSLGFSFDWQREINTTDPDYYKWTQWIFLQLYKNGLAYKKKMPINWCLSCKIGLANEEVIGNECERCGSPVEKREKEQWLLKITKYAGKLLEDLKTVDYLEKIKIQQANWIGKSEGAEIDFPVKNSKEKIKIFTTRPDTLFGATYMVLAPEHELIHQLENKISNIKEVKEYLKKAKRKSDLQRTDLAKEKTGVELKGIKAVNPANKKEIPVFVADYVLATYGTGAIMAVPAHDERDFEFAKKFKLPVEQVIAPYFSTNEGNDAIRKDKPTVKRKTAYAFLRDSKNNRYLCLDWEKFNWHSGIIGGVEEKEDYIEAAKREIQEETGYQDVKFVRYLGGEVHNHFFAGHKDVNRYAFGQGMLFELISNKKKDIDSENLKNHKPIWIDADKMREWLNLANFKYMWQILETGLDCFTGDGIMINSGKFDGMGSEKAKWEITKFTGGKKTIQYHLRDWIFSRQHYWGEPIPIIFCEKCGEVPVPEKDLPVKLPEVKNYQPTDTGESPLAAITNWVNVKCPKCGGKARRETDTMPNWAGSSWYFLRYIDPKNKKSLADFKKLKYWMPVDWYNGGMEHTTLHLLYSRFWNKFLYDIGAVPVSEPYKKRTSHGMILGKSGEKMSKSKGNVVNPDNIVKKFGADTFRLYEMFMGPFDQAISWDEQGLGGCRRFLGKIWDISRHKNISDKIENPALERLVNQTVKKVSEDVESMNFNTAVSGLMIFTNQCYDLEDIPRKIWETFLKILAPFAPFITEEIWEKLGHKNSIHLERWPQYDEKLIQEENFDLVIQINGKIRDKVPVPINISRNEAEKTALAQEKIVKLINTEKIKKIIFVPNRLINIVL